MPDDNIKINKPSISNPNTTSKTDNKINFKQPITGKNFSGNEMSKKHIHDLKTSKSDIINKHNLHKDIKDTKPKEKTYGNDVFDWNQIPTKFFPEASSFKAYKDVFFDNPIALLPMKMEIREMEAGKTYNMSAFETPDYNKLNNESRFKKEADRHLSVKKQQFKSKEYWIRWYPDDIQLPVPIGKITNEELEKWKKFENYYHSIINEITQKQNPKFVSEKENINIGETGKNPEPNPKYNKPSNKFGNNPANKFGNNPANKFGNNINITDGQVKSNAKSDNFEEKPQILTKSEIKIQALNQLVNVCARELEHVFGAIRARQLAKNMVLNDGKLTQGGDWDFDYEDESDDENQDALDILIRNGIELKTLPEKVALYVINKSGELIPIGNPVVIDRDKTKIHLQSLLSNKWMTNFNEAVKIGMGVKIIKPEEVTLINNASWLIAVGLNNSSESRYMLEEILQRRNAAGELSIVPQDSPTNNTETSRTNYSLNSSGILKHFEKTQDSISSNSTSTNDLGGKTDSFILSDMLNFYSETLGEMEGSGLQEQKEANAMSTILWDTCTPLFRHIWMDDFFKKADKDKHKSTIDNWFNLRRFFIKSVKARGNLPILRVGKNPYGVLPVVSLKKWQKFSEVAKDNEKVNSYNGYEENLDFLKDFLALLKNNYYKKSVKKVPKIEPLAENNTLETLLEILKTTRMSNEVDLRVIKAKEPFTMTGKSNSKGDSETMYIPMNIMCSIVAEKDKEVFPYLEKLSELDFSKIDEESFLQDMKIDQDGEKSSLFHRIIYSYLETLNISSIKLDKRIFKWVYRSYTFDEMKESAKILSALSHEKLENLFLETLDLLFYRLDAWITGLAYERLIAQTDKMEGPARIGAYGWIEKPGMIKKNTNNDSVYIQAPSLDQANTAAILYNASLSEETDDKPFQIDLTSNRVRKGLWYLDGLRKAHLPEELLGCLIERLIHDGQSESDSGLDEIDIYKLRKIYPLPLQKDETINNDEYSTFVETVINGLSFLEDEELPDILFTDEEYNAKDSKDKKKKNALDEIKRNVNDIRDASADISMSELTHQYMKGNQARTAAWLDFAQGKIAPPEPEFLKTYRTGQVFRSKVMMLIESPKDIVDPSKKEHSSVKNLRKMISPITSHFCEKMIPAFDKEKLTISKIKYSINDKNLEIKVSPGLKQLNMKSDLKLAAIDVVIGGIETINDRLEAYIIRKWRDGEIELPYDRNNTLSKVFDNLNVEFTISDELTKRIEQLNMLLSQAEQNSDTVSIAPTKAIKIIGKNNLNDFDPLESLEVLLLRSEKIIKNIDSLRQFLKTARILNNTSELKEKINELNQYGYYYLIAPVENNESEKQRFFFQRDDAIKFLTNKIEKMVYMLNDFIGSKIEDVEISKKIESEKKNAPNVIEMGNKLKGFNKPINQQSLNKHYNKNKNILKKTGIMGLGGGLSDSQFIKEKFVQNQIFKMESIESKVNPSKRWIENNEIIKNWIGIVQIEIRNMSKEDQLDYIVSNEYLHKSMSILKIAIDGRKMVIFPPFVLTNNSGQNIDWKISYNDPKEKIYNNSIENSDLIFTAKVRKPVRDILVLLNDSGFRNVIIDKYNKVNDDEDDSDDEYGDTDYYYLSTISQNNNSNSISSKYFTCFLVDTWTEFAPDNTGTGAISFRYDAPQAESPNSIILAIPPNISAKEILIKYKAKKKSKAKSIKSKEAKSEKKKKKKTWVTKWMEREDFWGKVGRFFRCILRKIWKCIKQILRIVGEELVKYEEDKAVDMIANTVKEAIELMQIRMVGSQQINTQSDLGKYLPMSLFREGDDKKLFPTLPKDFGIVPTSLAQYVINTQFAFHDLGETAKKEGGLF